MDSLTNASFMDSPTNGSPPDGCYRIANMVHDGAMFTSKKWFGARGDYAVGLSTVDKEGTDGQPVECTGKWRWLLERQPDATYKIASAQVGGALCASQRTLSDREGYHVALSPEDKEEEEGGIGKWRWSIQHSLGDVYKIENVGGAGVLGCTGAQFFRSDGDLQVACHPQALVATNWASMHWRLRCHADYEYVDAGI